MDWFVSAYHNTFLPLRSTLQWLCEYVHVCTCCDKVPLCSYWPAATRNQSSLDVYLDACEGLAQEASSADRWQLRGEKKNHTVLSSAACPNLWRFLKVKHVITCITVMTTAVCLYMEVKTKTFPVYFTLSLYANTMSALNLLLLFTLLYFSNWIITIGSWLSQSFIWILPGITAWHEEGEKYHCFQWFCFDTRSSSIICTPTHFYLWEIVLKCNLLLRQEILRKYSFCWQQWECATPSSQ